MAKPKKIDIKAKLHSFSRYAYNPENHRFFGRTCLSWFLIVLFYVVFYGLLAAFFVAMLCVLLFGVVNDSQPNLTGMQSLMRMVPSLDFRPRPEFDSTLINYMFKPSDLAGSIKSAEVYSNNLQTFYSSHSSVNASLEGPTVNYMNCNLSEPQANRGMDPTKYICRQNPAVDWGNCTAENGFGYKTANPCIVLKLNRMFGWMPTIDNSTLLNHTMVVCEPENDGDGANLGTIEYSPGISVGGTNYGYFSSALLPFLNQPGYTSATVAVRFVGIRHNVLVMVQCRLFNLKNVNFDRPNRIGSIHVEMLVRTV